MKDKFILGRYMPGDSIIHRLDPRTKIIAMITLMIFIFFVNNFVGYAILGAFILILITLSGISIEVFVRGLRPMLFLILFTVILQLFFTRSGELIWSWQFLTLTTDGLYNAFFILFRFVLIIFISTILTLTTQPLAITDGLEKLLYPVRNVFPVHEMALMLAIALRFVPTLMEETDKIMNAQRARGVDFNEGSLTERMKAIVPILIPLFISAFNRAYDLAIAMEARGYQGGEGRTKYRQLSWRRNDTIGLIFVVVICILVIITRS